MRIERNKTQRESCESKNTKNKVSNLNPKTQKKTKVNNVNPKTQKNKVNRVNPKTQ
jgi:hypothetical protein